VPFAGSQAELPVSSYEWRGVPVDLLQATPSCPVIGVPYAGIDPHPLLVGVWDPDTFIVSEDSDW